MSQGNIVIMKVVISVFICREKVSKAFVDMDPYEFALNKRSLGKLAPDFILQSNISPEKQWNENLKTEFLSHSCSSSAETKAEEVVAVIGKTDNW